MTPAKETVKAYLTIYRNLPWSQKMQLLTADSRPLDLSTWSGKLVIRESSDPAATILYTFATVDGSMVLSSNGGIELKIADAAIPLAFTWNQGVGHLVLQAPGEVPKVQAFFGFNIQNSTTDAP